jgi:aspartate kinase
VDGKTTTLGRNGSDYTATILGAALAADKVVINTDVPGVMTADPRIVEDAVPVSHLTFAEALELAVYVALPRWWCVVSMVLLWSCV